MDCLEGWDELDLDSQFPEDDLLEREAEVLVTIFPGQIGKVRVQTPGAYADRYARGENPRMTYPAGSWVKIAEVKKDMLAVKAAGKKEK